MAREFSRTERVAGQLQRELALILRKEMKDPRLIRASFTSVVVSRDLGHAKIYFTLIDSLADEREAVLKVLNNAAGFIRHQLGQTMRMRSIPQLKFYYDVVIEHANELSALIDSAIAADQSLPDDGEDEGKSGKKS
ncbi:MAG: 30S ribosome-binding factor RbfA [Gammaproteobacteria bacterium]|nr:30S ribosome-binding factor RbfA [Gammaproteobacteria bacterium]